MNICWSLGIGISVSQGHIPRRDFSKPICTGASRVQVFLSVQVIQVLATFDCIAVLDPVGWITGSCSSPFCRLSLYCRDGTSKYPPSHLPFVCGGHGTHLWILCLPCFIQEKELETELTKCPHELIAGAKVSLYHSLLWWMFEILHMAKICQTEVKTFASRTKRIRMLAFFFRL